VRALAVGVVVVLAGTGAARADEQPAPVRIVLLGPPAELEEAVRAALAPWRVAVIVEAPAVPGDARAAAAIADQHRANAVAWVDRGALVVFERSEPDLVRRPAEPLDDATAAALALTLKTLLRLPPEPPPPPPEPEPEPAPGPPPAVATPAPVPPPERPWRFTIAAGVRLRSEGSGEPRLTVRGERALGPIAIALAATVGSGVTVDSADYRGTWTDSALGAALVMPLPVAGWRLAPGAGLSVHRTVIDGAFQGNGGDGEASRTETNLGVDGEVEVARAWGLVSAGVRLVGSFVPYRQDFQTRGSNVFEVSPLELEIAAAAAISF
jgi:hypothetical protein